MKRDMELVREILLAIEASPSGFAPRPLQIRDYSAEQIGYHVLIMDEGGLIEADVTTTKNSASPGALAKRLTWQGHEFLDAARDPGIWKKAMGLVKEQAGSVTIHTLKELLVSLGAKALGLSP